MGWQQRVSRGQRWGWHCVCAGLAAGAAWFASCSVGIRQGCTGWEPRTGQTRGWAAAGAGAATVRANHSIATSGLSRTSGWIATVHRVSAPVQAESTTWAGGKYWRLTSSSVSRWKGQNISSSSMSNERAASKSRLYAMRVGGSTLNSLGVRTWRNCLLCCWAEIRGALRDRPPWWLCV